MLKIAKLHKCYLKNQPVLSDINLEVPNGKLITLLGENGSGKSTFLKLLTGLELPSSGSVQFNEHECSDFNFPYCNDIAFIHENINYIFPFSFEKFVERIKHKATNWDQELFYKIIHDRQLDITKNFQSFSRGQKMQLALSVAIASHTSTLLIDEITSVMDLYARKYFLDLLNKHVEKGNTVLITTNIINELEFYTEHLLILKEGKIVLDKPVDEIQQSFLKLKKDKDIEHEIFVHKDCVWAGVNSDKSISYIIPIDLLETFDVPEEFIDRRKSSLEDIFIFYFGLSGRKNESAA